MKTQIIITIFHLNPLTILSNNKYPCFRSFFLSIITLLSLRLYTGLLFVFYYFATKLKGIIIY